MTGSLSSPENRFQLRPEFGVAHLRKIARRADFNTRGGRPFRMRPKHLLEARREIASDRAGLEIRAIFRVVDDFRRRFACLERDFIRRAFLAATGLRHPKITFARPPDAPPVDSGVPRDAAYPPGGSNDGPNEHGPLVDMIANRIASIRVTWSDTDRFKDESQVQGLLRELLTSRHTTSYRWHVWSWGDARPALVATVEHRGGKAGRWIIWCPRPALYWAYQDGTGTWWWGSSERSSCSPVPSTEPNRIGMEFVRIEPGEFTMGCSAGDVECAEYEKPAHHVRLTKGFEIGKYEVTQAQWQSVVGSNPSQFRDDRGPVEDISWEDVDQFLRKLNAWHDGYRYRFPTEAEWEYAARASSTAPYAASVNSVGWSRDNSGGRSHPVGQKAPNSWGLYDMEGNVWEWVHDRPGRYLPGDATDPPGFAWGERLVRGGAWDSIARDIRLSSRSVSAPSFKNFDIGFRCVRETIR